VEGKNLSPALSEGEGERERRAIERVKESRYKCNNDRSKNIRGAIRCSVVYRLGDVA
jgi:hypothetical protein